MTGTTYICEQEHRLKDLRVPQLNKYLKHHHLNQHMKSGKSDKVRVIINQHRNKGNTEILRTEEYQTCNDDNCDDDGDDDDDDDDSNESDAVYEDVVLSIFGEVENLARPTITRSGRNITRRSEIDFFLF